MKREYYESLSNERLLAERDRAFESVETLRGSKGLHTTLRVAVKRSDLVGEVVMARMIKGTLSV